MVARPHKAVQNAPDFINAAGAATPTHAKKGTLLKVLLVALLRTGRGRTANAAPPHLRRVCAAPVTVSHVPLKVAAVIASRPHFVNRVTPPCPTTAAVVLTGPGQPRSVTPHRLLSQALVGMRATIALAARLWVGADIVCPHRTANPALQAVVHLVSAPNGCGIALSANRRDDA
ncbi:Hypothetical protein, putative [Bodo saltans]|uniref:Uncharacterized protein n=1 Tax=Bodo saltans TaxID=75058 RepID=A0A0S4IU82_BODSA|nr:Hypothetical protein, putative [Bodo saltans]|eukprot:CUE87203.1 Hypothetical protein, putative [Bodo saltans]